jgi:hypothetical protein
MRPYTCFFLYCRQWCHTLYFPVVTGRCVDKGKLFRKSSDVTIVVSYIISALISCNVVITNYVNRKIMSYIYLLIFTISLWLYCTKEKGKCEKNFFVVITDQDYPCQHIDQWHGLCLLSSHIEEFWKMVIPIYYLVLQPVPVILNRVD